MQSEQIKEKVKNTCIEKYGVSTALLSLNSLEAAKVSKGKHLYKGESFDSSWELAFYIYCEDHNINIKRNYEPIIFESEGKEHRYFPDFMVNNVFYEIKGGHFLNEDGDLVNGYSGERTQLHIDKQKCMQNIGVIVLSTKECKKYINYVKETYSKNYLSSFKI